MPVRVNIIQATIAILLVTVGTVFFPVAAVVVPIAGESGWMSVLMAFLLALPWAFMAGALVRKAPTGDWGKAVKAWLGPWAGRVFLLYFAFIWAWLGAYILAQAGQVFHAIAMPVTPEFVLSGALLLLLIQVDIKGVEVFVRSLEIISMLGIPLIIAFVFGVIPAMSSANLQPIFAEPPARLAHATLLCLPWAMEGILFSLFIGAHVKNNARLGLLSAGAVMLGGVFLAMVVVVTLGTLGRTVTELHVYPTMAVAQTSHLAFFLQGLELLLFPIWVLASFIKAGVSFVLVSESLRGVYGGFKQPYRSLVVGLVFLAIALIPSTTMGVVAALSRVDNTFFMAFYILLPLVWLWTVVKGKGKDESNAQG